MSEKSFYDLDYIVFPERESMRKIETNEPRKMSNFMKRTDAMFWRKKDRDKEDKPRKKLTNLPGIDNSLVKPSYPLFEWRGIAWTYDSKGNKIRRS